MRKRYKGGGVAPMESPILLLTFRGAISREGALCTFHISKCCAFGASTNRGEKALIDASYIYYGPRFAMITDLEEAQENALEEIHLRRRGEMRRWVGGRKGRKGGRKKDQ